MELLDFVVRLRDFAPFNAMLLHLQKPGLSYAATAKDWWRRFRRRPKEGARPLLILQPFGPVAPVFDLLDTDGDRVPEAAYCFHATGHIRPGSLQDWESALGRKNIRLLWVDHGDRRAGYIRILEVPKNEKEPTVYRLCVNRNHSPATQFVTIAHELAHLFLGHLGPDKKLGIPGRHRLSHGQSELEAESVAYLVCERKGIESGSKSYLSAYVGQHTTIDELDIYQVMRAAGRVESLLGLDSRS